MSDCIFCRIAEESEAGSFIYKDDDFMVIMDAYPLAEGHALVIPKQHALRLSDLSATKRNKLFQLGHRIMEAQKAAGIGVDGINLLLNDGKAANQTVPHLHLHLIPRRNSFELVTALPKLGLHMTGVFGFGIDRNKLDKLASEIRSHF